MPTTIASTSRGGLQGEERGEGVVWRGIPYATAERFAPPELVHAWTGTRSADRPGPQAPQLPSVLDRMLGPASLPQHEQCLTLDVWAPPPEPGARRPVLVWIHGGAFTNGTGAAPWFDGAAFVRAGCVLVTCNYRLGALGFLAAPALGPAAGNLGLLDQISALTWVREEIAAFGGDPGNVTAFGESAGGLSIVALLTSPLAEGRFDRAWAMSPSLSQLRTQERALDAADELARAAELSLDDADGWRALPVDTLLAAQAEVLGGKDPFTAFAPTPDDIVVPAAGVIASSSTGWGTTVPLVLGTTRDEMSLFTAFDPQVQGLDDAGLERRAQPLFGERTPAVLTAYRAAMPGALPGQLATAIATDHGFRMPATRVAELRQSVGAPTWLYWFTWPTPVLGGVLGSCHGVDIPFAFNALAIAGVDFFTGTAPERSVVADAFHGAIVDFARDGSVSWPRYEPATRAVWQVDVEPAVIHDPDPALRVLYE
jgi:para-nitrobenzyl esterase